MTHDNIIPMSNFKVLNKKNIVFAHEDIAGLQYGKFLSQSGFDIKEIVDNCDLFINGHLHNSQFLCNNKILLVGNLTGQNFNEDAFKYSHNAYIISVEDSGDVYLDTYENPYAMNFYHLRIDKPEDLNIFEKLKNNGVLSISCNSDLIDDLNKVLKKKKTIIDYKINTYYKNQEQISNDELFKVENHFKQFIDFAQKRLEPSSILSDELSRLNR